MVLQIIFLVFRNQMEIGFEVIEYFLIFFFGCRIIFSSRFLLSCVLGIMYEVQRSYVSNDDGGDVDINYFLCVRFFLSVFIIINFYSRCFLRVY